MYDLKTELSNVNFVTEIVRKSPLIIIAHLRFKLSSVCFKMLPTARNSLLVQRSETGRKVYITNYEDSACVKSGIVLRRWTT